MPTGPYVLQDSAFRAWLLGTTKFAPYAEEAHLLHDEQSRRPAKAWWRHWWCRVPSVGRESETDIFLAFSAPSGPRFALQIENKIGAAFQTFQPEDYPLRAAHMRSNRWAPYEDFATILMAPCDTWRRTASAAVPSTS